jgi:hypothetical protein
MSGASAAIGPPSCPPNTCTSLSACSSLAWSSTNTPSFQLPSVITFGVSAIAATLRPATSVPSISPSRMSKTSVTRQKSYVAPWSSDRLHGHISSHEQVSTYSPVMLQDIGHLRLGKGGSIVCLGRSRVNPRAAPRARGIPFGA